MDPSGRCGRVESFWLNDAFGADRAQLHTEFDLERPLTHRVDGRRVFALPAGNGLGALARHAVLLKIGQCAADRGAVDGQRRNDARLHLVRGHIVNRRGRLFWPASHLRGRPDIAPIRTRTANVTLDPGFGMEAVVPG